MPTAIPKLMTSASGRIDAPPKLASSWADARVVPVVSMVLGSVWAIGPWLCSPDASRPPAGLRLALYVHIIHTLSQNCEMVIEL